jgi:hypothetical protein
MAAPQSNGIEPIAYKGAEASNARTADRKLGFYNKRSETWWKLREALDPSRAGGSGIELPDDQELLSDLTSVRFSAVQHRGAMCIKAETKEDVVKRLGRSPGSGRGNLTVVEAYDPATDQWTSMADLPTPRGGHTAATIEERIHVTGGEDLASADTFSDHWAYDPATDHWTAETPMPTARHGLDSAAHGQRWYVVGGGTGAGARTFFTLTNLIEVYVAR